MIDCPQLFHNDCQSLMSKIHCPRNFRRIHVVAHCMKLWSRLMSSDGLRWWSQKTDLKTHVEKGFALVQAQRLQISYNDDLSGHFWNRQLCLAIIHDSMKLRAVAPSGCFCHLPACQRKVEEVAKILLHTWKMKHGPILSRVGMEIIDSHHWSGNLGLWVKRC